MGKHLRWPLSGTCWERGVGSHVEWFSHWTTHVDFRTNAHSLGEIVTVFQQTCKRNVRMLMSPLNISRAWRIVLTWCVIRVVWIYMCVGTRHHLTSGISLKTRTGVTRMCFFSGFGCGWPSPVWARGSYCFRLVQMQNAHKSLPNEG